MRRTAGSTGNWAGVAELQNGEPLLYRAPTDRVESTFVVPSPTLNCSTLAMDGVALYIMLQRLIQEGAQGLSPAQTQVPGVLALPSFEDWDAANEQSREIPKHDRRWQAVWLPK